jgi:hypothetical protein
MGKVSRSSSYFYLPLHLLVRLSLADVPLVPPYDCRLIRRS